MYCQPTLHRTTLPRWRLSSCSQRACARATKLLYVLFTSLQPPLPPPHTPGSSNRLGLPEVRNRTIDPKKKQLRHFLSNSFPPALPWQGGETTMLRPRQGGGRAGLKGRPARQLRRGRLTAQAPLLAGGGGRGRMQTLFSSSRLLD